ncbi:MAG: hypothetical protein JSS87_13280 [Acidobacteria bacterium]|nr:hypothetical protein [Acidobacteriota bacterium]
MRILFAIAILCCCALIWAAISIARHIRKAHHDETAAKHPSFAETLVRGAYEDPPVGGQRARVHPREDLAASFKNTTRKLSGSERTGDNDVRSDWKYYNRDSGDLSDPDARRISGILPSTQRKRF